MLHRVRLALRPGRFQSAGIIEIPARVKCVPFLLRGRSDTQTHL